MTADLRHIDTWIFDLDNTLYPEGDGPMVLVSEKMTQFVMNALGLPHDEARVLQKRYLADHGTTLAGLMANHGVAPAEFMAFVHDVGAEMLRPDPALRAELERLPGRRLVFTNGPEAHAVSVLAQLRIDDLFEDIFHIEAADYVPKPQVETFNRMMRRHGVAPLSSAFFEDTERNLDPAAALGMTTILIGASALTCEAPFVHHRAETLPPFLAAAQVQDPP